jgi:Tfp pilus assembly protein PilF
MKGKVSEALSYGLPVVTTSVGAEGIGIVDGVHALVADTREEFADAICRVIEDEILWKRLSSGGKRLIEERWGTAHMRQRLEALLPALLASQKPVTRVRQSDAVAPKQSEADREPALQYPEQCPAYVEALGAAESGDTDRAIRLLTNHLAELPGHAGGWSDLGVLYYRKGSVQQAQEHFKRALATPGGWRTLACENLVECLLAWGEREQARELAQDWTEKAGDMPEPWLLWARLSFEDGQIGEARDAAKRALSIDPTNEAAEAHLSYLDAAKKTARIPNEDVNTTSSL